MKGSDSEGYFGEFGGRYVAEVLRGPLEELEAAFVAAMADPDFVSGLDLALDEASWDKIAPSHPQWGLRRLLERLGATRGDVRAIPTDADPGREALFRRALLPADTLSHASAAS